jgi:hypothetical protein
MLERAVVAGETSVSSPTIMDRASHASSGAVPSGERLPGFARAASLQARISAGLGSAVRGKKAGQSIAFAKRAG